MKILLRLALAAVLLVALLVGVGFVLPASYAVSRSLDFTSPPEKIWPLLDDPRAWARWTIWNKRDPAMKMRYAGPASGVGAEWAWASETEGNGRMRFVAAEAPHRLTYVLEFVDFDGGTNQGTLTLAPQAGGTRVTWAMQGEMGRNPISRWFGLFMDRLVGPDFDDGLARLRGLTDGR